MFVARIYCPYILTTCGYPYILSIYAYMLPIYSGIVQPLSNMVEADGSENVDFEVPPSVIFFLMSHILFIYAHILPPAYGLLLSISGYILPILGIYGSTLPRVPPSSSVSLYLFSPIW